MMPASSLITAIQCSAPIGHTFFSKKVFSNFTLTSSHYFNYPTFNIASTPYERSNNIFDYSLKGDFEYLPQNNHAISLGFKIGSLTLKLEDKFDNQRTFQSRTQTKYGSFYLQDEWLLSDKWIATPGIRVSAFSEGSYFRLEPRFSLEYRASDDLRLQAAYGQYNQFLTLISNDAFAGFDVWLTPNEEIGPAYGNQYVAGIKSIPWQNYQFDVELYYRSMENLFEPNPIVPNQAGLAYPEIFRFGNGYAYGAEIYFERRRGRLTGFLGYTFGISRRKFSNINDENTPPDIPEQFYPPKHDRTHDLNLVLDLKLSSRWSTNLVFNYATGQAFTKPLGRTAAFDFPTNNNRIDQLLMGRVNASRLPPYHRLDMGLIRKGTFLGMGKAEWQFQLINVYSRRNIWFYDYDLEQNPAKRKAAELLPILPSISYTLDF